MPDNAPELITYQKASRAGRGFFSMYRLWKAPDHLLLIKEMGWNEEYKRFYFEDIQAFTVMWSKGYVIWGLLFPFFAIILFSIIWSYGAHGWALAAAVLMLVFMVIHLLRGRTCKCWLQTGINKERLHMLSRVSHARKFWTEIGPQLVAVQGEFSLETMDAEGTFPDRKMRPVPPAMPKQDESAEEA